MSDPIIGKIVSIGPIEQVGRNNSDKRTFVITYMSGKYEKHLALDVWKDRCKFFDGVPVGTLVDVRFDVESREHDGRWYTNATAWSVKPVEPSEEEKEVRREYDTEPNGVDTDNLPF